MANRVPLLQNVPTRNSRFTVLALALVGTIALIYCYAFPLNVQDGMALIMEKGKKDNDDDSYKNEDDSYKGKGHHHDHNHEEKPDKDEPKICCMAMTADCLSCSAGLSKQEYCKENPSTAGCEDEAEPVPVPVPEEPVSVPEEPVLIPQVEQAAEQTAGVGAGQACCQALTPQCQACKEGTTVKEYCEKYPSTDGCEGQRLCCRAQNADCLSCSTGVTVAEYCEDHPDTVGCEQPKSLFCKIFRFC